MSASSNSYEQLPCENRPMPATRPDVLATLATLSGLSPAPVASCRVLEIGCAVGGNLLPMAQALPESTFVGIDLSPRQIALAQRTASGAGLSNVRLEVRDLASITPEFGQFDYVIAHAIYSWVPPATAQKLLEVLAQNLSPDGLAYVSYNVYPGWHAREMFRDLLASEAGFPGDAKATVAGARQLIALLQSQAQPSGQSAYASHLHQEAAFIASAPDDFLAHDYLGANSRAVYFQEFVGQLHQKGLDFVGEVRANPTRRTLAEALRAGNAELAGDWVKLEQYVDYIQGGSMRRSLLCRAGRAVSRSLTADRIDGLQLRATAVPAVNQGDIRSAAPIPFRMPDGAILEITDPLTKAVMVALARIWPGAATVEQVIPSIRADLQLGEGFAAPGSYERQLLLQTVMSCYATSMLDLHVHAPRFMPVAGEKPRASALARYQARESQAVANTLHYLVQGLSKLQRLVLAHLNGARDRAALAGVLRSAIAKGVLPEPFALGAAEAGFVGTFEQSVEQALARLAKDAFLVE